MANLDGFDANQYEPNAGFDPLPAGKYLAIITNSEKKATKSGTGTYLELVFTVVHGPCKSRKVWARLNITNANAQAQEIARGDLSAICRAVGVMTPKDSIELHNLPLVITVTQKVRKDTGEIANEVRGYAPKSEYAALGAAQTAPPAAVAAPAAPAANAAPPAPAATQAAPDDPNDAPWQ